MNTLFILLGAAPEAAPKHTPTFMEQYGMLIMMVAIFVIMYFFMIRPQKKKQKELQNWRNSISVGTNVVTAGGMLGVVKAINEAENTISVEVSKGVCVNIDRNCVFASAPVQQA